MAQCGQQAARVPRGCCTFDIYLNLHPVGRDMVEHDLVARPVGGIARGWSSWRA